ncbi:hypothetical protein OH799_15710 [Nocardia sp. NBC_00881]|uniref:hypothetical protein n=1 Tax=Nocardia sp. NBC_00881 TaxID=2975995 RepID=UPI00386D42EC|nr:hypothetical protein OH799_15710 [Nocardia sp. NBC_00881]
MTEHHFLIELGAGVDYRIGPRADRDADRRDLGKGYTFAVGHGLRPGSLDLVEQFVAADPHCRVGGGFVLSGFERAGCEQRDVHSQLREQSESGADYQQFGEFDVVRVLIALLGHVVGIRGLVAQIVAELRVPTCFGLAGDALGRCLLGFCQGVVALREGDACVGGIRPTVAESAAGILVALGPIPQHAVDQPVWELRWNLQRHDGLLRQRGALHGHGGTLRNGIRIVWCRDIGGDSQFHGERAARCRDQITRDVRVGEGDCDQRLVGVRAESHVCA